MEPTERFALFLSHGGPDAIWVKTLHGELSELDVSAFLDQNEIDVSDNFVKKLSDGLEESGTLALVLSAQTLARPWVEQEWTVFMATRGPRGRILIVLLEDVTLPAFLRNRSVLRAVDRDAARVARKIAATLGKGGVDAETFRGMELGFALELGGGDDKEPAIGVRGADGTAALAPAPWREPGFGVAWLEYHRLIREATETDAERAELHRHARTSGEAFFGVLFGADMDRQRLAEATRPGAERRRSSSTATTICCCRCRGSCCSTANAS
jgi:hypothetical protein